MSQKGPRRNSPRHHANQLKFDWMAAKDAADPMMTVPNVNAATAFETQTSPTPLIQSLPWDFRESFLLPTPEAIKTGIIRNEDLSEENIQAIHDEHARELLVILHDLDAVRDARRRGVDPTTGKPPRSSASRERLQRLFETEPQRLEQAFQSLMDSYESAFGSPAADAFAKAIRARHAGIEVVADSEPKTANAGTTSPEPVPDSAPPVGHAARIRSKRSKPRSDGPESRRVVARLPVPKPLPEAVAAGHFGHDDDQHPIRPGPAEVRAITEEHADKLIEIVRAMPQRDDAGTTTHPINEQLQTALAAYAEDFGTDAAKQLEAYARRQASLDDLETRRHR